MDVQEHDSAQPQDATTEGAAEAPEVVADLAGLYKYSGMVDGLRDALKYLVKTDVSRQMLQSMGKQYNELRTAIDGILPGGVQEWTQEVDADTVTVDSLYMATVMLARWSDLVYQTPTFLAREQMSAAVQAAQAAHMEQALGPNGPGLAGLMPGMGQAAGAPSGGVPAQQTGQYL